MSETYRRGTLILRNHPIAYVVDEARRSEICAFCFQSETAAKRCGKCKFVCYCSQECQKKHWKEAHKYECEGLSKLEEPLSSFMHLLVQTVVQIVLGRDTEDPKKNVTPFQRKFYDLASHWSEARNDPEIFTYVQNASRRIEKLVSTVDVTKKLEVEELGEIYSRIKSNAYAVQGAFNEAIGHGLFLSAGKFDHSCKPSACQSYDGPDMLVHAITDVPRLEDVRVTYISLTAPTRVRRKQLQEQYFFHCECPGCLDEEHDRLIQSLLCPTKNCGAAVPFIPPGTGTMKCPNCRAPVPGSTVKKADALMKDSDAVLAKAESILSTGDAKKVIQMVQPVLRDGSGLLHMQNYVICTAAMLSSSAYTFLRSHDLAFTFGQTALEGTNFAYPSSHIAVVSHMMNVIQLGLMLPLRDSYNLYDDLIHLAQMAVESAVTCAGKDTSVTRKAQALLEKVTEAMKVVALNGHGCGGSCGHHH